MFEGSSVIEVTDGLLAAVVCVLRHSRFLSNRRPVTHRRYLGVPWLFLRIVYYIRPYPFLS
jgi:hypothetical protein